MTVISAYRVLRADRASGSTPAPKVGDVVYPTGNDYGCAHDDSRITGVPHVAVSLSSTGYPFFTIPLEDLVDAAKETP